MKQILGLFALSLSIPCIASADQLKALHCETQDYRGQLVKAYDVPAADAPYLYIETMGEHFEGLRASAVTRMNGEVQQIELYVKDPATTRTMTAIAEGKVEMQMDQTVQHGDAVESERVVCSLN